MSVKPDIWMPLYIGDYLSATTHLSAEESGAYLHLLMHAWKNGALPAEDDSLRRIARVDKDAWSIVWASLKHFFSITVAGPVQLRLEEIRADWQVKKAAAEAKAAAAAAKRWGNRQGNASSSALGNAPSTPQAMPQLCPSSSSSPSVSTNVDTKETISRERERDVVKTVFAYYLTHAGKSEAYVLTAGRMEKGLLRWRECLKLAGDDEQKALDLMQLAVDGLCNDPWNKGGNPQGKRYMDWTKHLFGSSETMSTRIENAQVRKGR